MTEPSVAAQPENESCPFAALFERARKGDQAAATELVEQYGHPLRHIIRRRLELRGERRLREKMDSTDLMQETWLTMWRKAVEDRLTFSDPAAFLAFLARIAEHKVRQAQRHYFETDRRNIRRESRVADLDSLPW